MRVPGKLGPFATGELTMGMPLELFIYIGVFALGLGLLGCFLGESDNEKLKLRAAHERRSYER
jgi:hypothetical protein